MTLKMMQNQRDAIALEAFSVADAQSVLKNFFPSIVSSFTGFVSSFSSNEPPITLTGNQKDFLNELRRHTYVDLIPLTAYVPEGLHTTYLEYIGSLELAVDHAVALADNVLPAYTLFLSQVITNHDVKFSTASAAKVNMEMAKARHLINQDIGNCFDRGSTKTDVNYGKVVGRNSDWEGVFKYVEALTTRINKVDRKMLQKKIAECAELLNTIATKIKRGDFDGVSPEIVDGLADGAFQIASELEFYSVTYYRVTALAKAVSDTITHFKTAFAH